MTCIESNEEEEEEEDEEEEKKKRRTERKKEQEEEEEDRHEKKNVTRLPGAGRRGVARVRQPVSHPDPGKPCTPNKVSAPVPGLGRFNLHDLRHVSVSTIPSRSS